ncbi:MAG: hypothetical protein DMF60_15885 [Acidobacteria bacterium]|nr:MAG: hypothetical protein DMF60_15885 [Acidobacteriota bacterium]
MSLPPAVEANSNRTARRGRLLQILGVGFGLAVIIGNTIGAGILSTPGSIAQQLPNAWLFIGVWVGGGLYALLGAISIAELGTMIPRSGGQYVFAHEALGDYAGFIVGWSDWISTCGTISFISLIVAQYAAVLFPSLAGRSTALALAIVVVFAVIQWRGIRWGSSVQNVTSLVKALAFVALVLACFLLGGSATAPESAIAQQVPHGLKLFVAVILALQGVIYTYDGWTGVIYFSEEVRNPARDIPRAMFGGVLSVIAIYLLVNLAILYVLPISEIAGSDLALGKAARSIFTDDSLYAKRGECLPVDGDAGFVRNEQGRALFDQGRPGERRRHADGRSLLQHAGSGAFHCYRDGRSGPRGGGLLLRRELCNFVCGSFPFSPA